MSHAKSLGLFVLVLFQNFVTTGTVYGWTSLLVILRDSGVFSNLCSAGSVTCDAREFQLNVMYNIGAWGVALGGVIGGVLMDGMGSKLANFYSSCVAFIGALILGAAFTTTTENAYIVGFGIFTTGCGGIFYSNFHFCNLFPTHLATAISFLSASFDLSSLTFVIYFMIWEAGAISLGGIFFAHAILLFVLMMTSFFLTHPWSAYSVGDAPKLHFPCISSSSSKSSSASLTSSASSSAAPATQEPSKAVTDASEKHASESAAPIIDPAHPHSDDDVSPVHSDAQTEQSSAEAKIDSETHADGETAVHEKDVMLGENAGAVSDEHCETQAGESVDGSAVAEVAPPAESESTSQVEGNSDAKSNGVHSSVSGDSDKMQDVVAVPVEPVPAPQPQLSTREMWMLFFRTIMSRPYIYLALFLSFSWLRYSLFLSSASEMLVRTYGASESQSLIMLRVYSWIIPAGALTVPIVGKFLERFGSPLSMAVSTALSAALTLTICIPSLYAQYASFVLWAVGRTWLFSTYYATTGMLPAAVAGRAASFGILIMSTFSLLVMFLFWLGSSPFSGNFIPVFLILISLLIAQMVISRWFIARQRAMQEKEIAERQVQIAQSLAKDEHTKTVSEVAASTI